MILQDKLTEDDTATQPCASTQRTVPDDEEYLWLPPQRLIKYQLAKVSSGILVLAIFAGWMIIQWTHVGMRLLTVALSIVTIWVTVASLVLDARRARGRQLRIEPGRLIITTPTTTIHVDVDQIAHGQWRDEPNEHSGLWLYDHHGLSLAHLDKNFLASQAEAGAFLGWARRLTKLPFDVQWPRSSS